MQSMYTIPPKLREHCRRRGEKNIWAEGGVEWCGTWHSRHDLAIALLNSQPLWSFVQVPDKIRPVNVLPRREEGCMRSQTSVKMYRQLMVAGGERKIFFSDLGNNKVPLPL